MSQMWSCDLMTSCPQHTAGHRAAACRGGRGHGVRSVGGVLLVPLSPLALCRPVGVVLPLAASYSDASVGPSGSFRLNTT